MTAQDYIRKIRNKAKQSYAWDYFYFLEGELPEPVRPPKLSSMAAQSVRIQLDNLRKLA
jgi:hypothetical protein